MTSRGPRLAVAATAALAGALVLGPRLLTETPVALRAGEPRSGVTEAERATHVAEAAGFRISHLPSGFSEVRRQQDRYPGPDGQGRLYHVLYFDDGTGIAPPEKGSNRQPRRAAKPADREIIVTIISGGPSPEGIAKISSYPGAKEETIRGRPGAFVSGPDFLALKWVEDANHEIFISGRGISERELRQIAEEGIAPS